MEKVTFFWLSLFVGFLFWISISFFGYAGQEFMSLERAEKKWGQSKFVASKFKLGDERAKASMVVDLIKSKVYLGKPIEKVKGDLGDPTGYFQNDGIYSYNLTPVPTSKDEVGEIWQVVFMPDKSWKIVKEVKIHKNCCGN